MVKNPKTVLMFEDVYTRLDKGLNPMDHSNQRKKKHLFYLLLMMLVYSCSKEIKTMPERKKEKRRSLNTHLIAVAPELAKFSKQIHLYRQCT